MGIYHINKEVCPKHWRMLKTYLPLRAILLLDKIHNIWTTSLPTLPHSFPKRSATWVNCLQYVHYLVLFTDNVWSAFFGAFLVMAMARPMPICCSSICPCAMRINNKMTLNWTEKWINRLFTSPPHPFFFSYQLN